MPELRWALIGLGVLFLAGLALWEWRRSRREPARTTFTEPPLADITLNTERPRRLEPGLSEIELVDALSSQPEGHLEVPSIHAVEPLPVSAETAVDVPAAARGSTGEFIAGEFTAAPAPPAPPATIRWPPEKTERVLTLRIVQSGNAPFGGRAVRIALEAAGLVPGPQVIYHRVDADGAVLVSAANLLRPGTLDPAHIDGEEFRGLSLFSVLPGPLPPVRMLEELVATARSLAHRLSAQVQDEHGEELDGLKLGVLRRSLPEEGAGNDPPP